MICYRLSFFWAPQCVAFSRQPISNLKLTLQEKRHCAVFGNTELLVGQQQKDAPGMRKAGVN